MEQDKFTDWGVPEKIQVVESDGMVRVLVEGKTYMNWMNGDEVAERIAIVQLYELGLGTQEELAKNFKMHVNSIAKHINTFRADGASGLISQIRGPKQSWLLTPEVRAKILFLVLNEGIREYRLIQKRLEQWNTKVSTESIRQVLIENGLVKENIIVEEPEIEQGDFFENLLGGQYELEFSNSENNVNDEGMPLIRNIEKNLKSAVYVNSDKNTHSDYSRSQRVYLNQLEQGIYNSYAGGLLFIPLLRQYNYFSTIRKVINMETYEGYSLDELCLTLLYCNVFGFRSIENFKTVYPEEFGILIGKLYSPSIFTIRRFLHKIRKLKKGEQLMEEFGKEYLSKGLVKWGVLYIDSHFLPYYGICLISMGWHGVRQKPMRGSYNFLAVDDKYNPLIFFIRPSSEDLLKKIPELILKAKDMAKNSGIPDEKLVVVFDREGYSAELFREMDSDNLRTKFITWAKYFDSWKPGIKEEQFRESVTIKYEIQKEEEVKYFEAENRTMNKYGKIRAIVIQSGRKKKQTAIYTNDWEMPASLIIQLICRRWGQETLIKTLKLDHRIDYFPGYESGEIEKQPMVDNPRMAELKRSRANLVTDLHKLKLGFADILLNKVSDEISWQEVKEKKIKTLADIQSIRTQMLLIDHKIDELPAKVKFEEVHNGERLVEFDYEKKRFLDCIKIFSYTMQKAACKILSKYYDDPKDVWQILGMITQRGADIKLNGNILTVKLKKFADVVVDYAARHLCEELNEMAPVTLDKFHFQLRYEVA